VGVTADGGQTQRPMPGQLPYPVGVTADGGQTQRPMPGQLPHLSPTAVQQIITTSQL